MAFNPEFKVRWEQLAPSLQRIIKRKIGFQDLDQDLYNWIMRKIGFGDLDEELYQLLIALKKLLGINPDLDALKSVLKFSNLWVGSYLTQYNYWYHHTMTYPGAAAFSQAFEMHSLGSLAEGADNHKTISIEGYGEIQYHLPTTGKDFYFTCISSCPAYYGGRGTSEPSYSLSRFQVSTQNGNGTLEEIASIHAFDNVPTPVPSGLSLVEYKLSLFEVANAGAFISFLFEYKCDNIVVNFTTGNLPYTDKTIQFIDPEQHILTVDEAKKFYKISDQPIDLNQWYTW